MPRGKGVTVKACPLKFEVCYPSCHWWKDGGCNLEQVKSEPLSEDELIRRFPHLFRDEEE